jgi:hypothetical protein
MNTQENVSTSTQASLITREDAAVLRAARELLYRLAEKSTDAGIYAELGRTSGAPGAMAYGRLSALAAVAEDAIFGFLNAAYHHGDEKAVDLSIDRTMKP